MKKINLLVWVNSNGDKAVAKALADSPLVNKIYTTSDFKIKNAKPIDITDKDFRKQAKKSAELGINLVIFGGENAIYDGAVNIFKNEGIAAVGVNKTFAKLGASKIFAKKFMNKYGIKTPQIKPDKYDIYPQVIKSDNCMDRELDRILYNPGEKIKALKEFKNKNFFIEEFLEGEKISVTTYLTGGNFTHFMPFYIYDPAKPLKLTSNQKLRLNIYLCKFEYALLLENANFDGAMTTDLTEYQNDWYVLKYRVNFGEKEIQEILMHIDNDFLDILINGTEPVYKKV